ncbi:MAG: PEP/pyruvate-binding domain-containing protein [Candidatus Kerfeldbacteria bacterium]
MTTFTKTFRQLSRADVGIAGGKGASLGEMTHAGIPVPPGFVVLASAFDRFLHESQLDVEIESILHLLKHTDVNAVDRVSNEIRELILDEEMPKDLGKEIMKQFASLRSPAVAVRSSATAEDSSVASWAGELESYLNVKKAGVLDAVRKCWSSLFTPRAIFYRFEKKLHKQNVSVAVVVQAMVQSETSGICFTVHPVTKDYDQMVIEAGWGLGEAIVGGKITPDTFVIHTTDWTILDASISEQTMMIVRGPEGTVEKKVPAARANKQKLPNSVVMKLAKICKHIEEHYGKPQDIEWAYRNKKFYIVQSRPITTL